jgi:hypothetical protein
VPVLKLLHLDVNIRDGSSALTDVKHMFPSHLNGVIFRVSVQ